MLNYLEYRLPVDGSGRTEIYVSLKYSGWEEMSSLKLYPKLNK